MSELTFDEFCQQPLTYMLGMSGDWGARRLYRNNELGVQKEVHTKRKRHGDIYSGWQEGQVSYFLDGDPREFKSSAELYEAWMAKVCGVEVET